MHTCNLYYLKRVDIITYIFKEFIHRNSEACGSASSIIDLNVPHAPHYLDKFRCLSLHAWIIGKFDTKTQAPATGSLSETRRCWKFGLTPLRRSVQIFRGVSPNYQTWQVSLRHLLQAPCLQRMSPIFTLLFNATRSSDAVVATSRFLCGLSSTSSNDESEIILISLCFRACCSWQSRSHWCKRINVLLKLVI